MGLTRSPQKLDIVDWSGGLNTLFEENKIWDNETPDCENVMVTKNGVITRRPWTAQLGTTQPGAYPVTWLFSFQQYDQSSELLKVHNADLYRWSGTAWWSLKSGLTAGLETRMLVYDGFVGSATVTGTATGTQTTTTMQDTWKAWNIDSYKWYILQIAPTAQVSTFTIATNPWAGETIVVGAKTYTFVASWATGDQINIGATADDTANNIETKIDTDTAYTLCTATSPTNTVICTANTAWVPFAVLGDGTKITVLTGTANYYGESHPIKSNTLNVLTIDGLFDTIPTTAVTAYSIKSTDLVSYFFNGTDKCFKYDGTSVADVETIPKGSIVTVFDKRFYVVPKGQENQLYYSAYDDVENFQKATITGTGTGIIRPPSPDPIVGIRAKGDSLIIYKTKSKWIHTWTTDSYGNLSPTIQIMENEAGAYNDQIIEVNNDLWNLSKTWVTRIGAQEWFISTGFSQIRADSVSDKIKNLINLTAESQKVYSRMHFDGRFVYLSVDTGELATNDTMFLYDTTFNSWWKYTLGANCFVTHNGTTYYWDVATGKVWYFSSSVYTDDGSAFTSYYKTKVHNLGDFDAYKYLYQCNLELENLTSEMTLTVFSENNVSKSTFGSSFSTGTGTGNTFGTLMFGNLVFGRWQGTTTNISSFKRPRKQLNITGQTFQLKVSDNDTNGTFVLTSINLLYRPHQKGYFPVGYKF